MVAAFLFDQDIAVWLSPLALPVATLFKTFQTALRHAKGFHLEFNEVTQDVLFNGEKLCNFKQVEDFEISDEGGAAFLKIEIVMTYEGPHFKTAIFFHKTANMNHAIEVIRSMARMTQKPVVGLG